MSCNDFHELFKILDHYKKTEPPVCDHLMPYILWISRSENIPAKPFFKCSKRELHKFFQWADIFLSLQTLKNEGKKDKKRKITSDKSMTTDTVVGEAPIAKN